MQRFRVELKTFLGSNQCCQCGHKVWFVGGWDFPERNRTI